MRRIVQVGLTLSMLLILAAPVQAQLSAADIAALRAQGEREGWTFTVGENPATQYSREQLCGVVEPPDWRTKGTFDVSTPRNQLPASYDWRTQGKCTPIRNQGGCGSCWAFGLMGAVEANIAIKDNALVNLSEQWLVSCCGLGGCAGDWPGNAANFLLCSGQYRDSCNGYGAVLEKDFRYVGSDAPCHCPYAHPYCLTSWTYVGPAWDIPTVAQLKQAILDHGPVTVCVNASSAFQAYTGGVFNADDTSDLNHAVALVGWDDNQGSNGVWLLRNSWGNWGEQGYMRIAYGCCLVGYGALYVDYYSRPIPHFTQQPSGHWMCAGDTVSLSVAVDIAAPAYRWRMGTNALVDDGVHISGANTATLTIANLTQADISGQYNCLVTETVEGGTSVSNDAIVYVYNPITFTGQPANQTLSEYQTAVFSVTASGDSSLSYQWRHNGANVADDGGFQGTTTPTLIIWSAGAPLAGYYDCMVSNLCGPMASNAAHLIVNSAAGAGRGDLNCDGSVNFKDINAFVLAISGSEDGYYNAYPDCYWYNADINADGSVGFRDINPFVSLLAGK